MENKLINLRAHHGLCFNFFCGNGYDRQFVEHMKSIHNCLKKNPLIKIVIYEDIICRKCPNLYQEKCRTSELVNQYDKKVLDFCNLKENTIIYWNEFSNIVKNNIILSGKRKSICKNCQWTKICDIEEKKAEKL